MIKRIWRAIPPAFVVMSLLPQATLAEQRRPARLTDITVEAVAHRTASSEWKAASSPVHEKLISSVPTETTVTGAGAAVPPAGTTFSGVTISRLRFGIGVTLHGDGTADGFFITTLTGYATTGAAREIVVQGEAVNGSVQADGLTSFAGTCTLDLGNGTPIQTGVPYTLTLASSPTGQRILSLTLAGTSLPAAPITSGTITIN